MKINRTHKSVDAYDKKKPKEYDIVMTYCKYCQERLDIHVYHAFGKAEHYQLVNLPERIAKYLKTRKIQCNHCDRKFVLEKNIQNQKTDFLLKLDCSNMG